MQKFSHVITLVLIEDSAQSNKGLFKLSCRGYVQVIDH